MRSMAPRAIGKDWPGSGAPRLTGRRTAQWGTAWCAFAGQALALNKQDRLIGFTRMLGAVAFDEHAR